VNLLHKTRQVRDENPLDMNCRGYGCDLRRFVGANFRLAATHLLHVPALTVHGTAAGALFVAHGYAGQAGHNGSGCGEQEEDRDDAGETTHDYL
jgi:hypothetical protein